jgi:hypothetical protein
MPSCGAAAAAAAEAAAGVPLALQGRGAVQAATGFANEDGRDIDGEEGEGGRGAVQIPVTIGLNADEEHCSKSDPIHIESRVTAVCATRK